MFRPVLLSGLSYCASYGNFAAFQRVMARAISLLSRRNRPGRWMPSAGLSAATVAPQDDGPTGIVPVAGLTGDTFFRYPRQSVSGDGRSWDSANPRGPRGVAGLGRPDSRCYAA